MTRSSIFHVSDTFSHLLTIHHSTQQHAENGPINLSFLNIFEYQHFSCSKKKSSRQAAQDWSQLSSRRHQVDDVLSFNPVRVRYLPALTDGLPFNADVSDILHNTTRDSPKNPKSRLSAKHTHLPPTTSYTYIYDHTSSAQYQAVALWPGWVPPKRYCYILCHASGVYVPVVLSFSKEVALQFFSFFILFSRRGVLDDFSVRSRQCGADGGKPAPTHSRRPCP